MLATAALSIMVAVASNEQAVTVAAGTTPATKSIVDTSGNLRVPDRYRTSYEFLGSWAVAADPGQGSKELHVVYASPGTVAAYRKDGHFPDGTVLVKEVFQTTSQSMTTGTVSRADGLKGWFVMMKDNENRYSKNKLWGDGWGWSWFDVPDSSKTTSTDYKTNCLGCHIPARASDWVYVDGYPPLKP